MYFRVLWMYLIRHFWWVEKEKMIKLSRIRIYIRHLFTLWKYMHYSHHCCFAYSNMSPLNMKLSHNLVLLLPTPRGASHRSPWSPSLDEKPPTHCTPPLGAEGEVGWKKNGSQNKIHRTDGRGEALQNRFLLRFPWWSVVQVWQCGRRVRGFLFFLSKQQ